MLKSSLLATLLLGTVIAIPVSSEARPIVSDTGPAISNIVPVQDWRERCHWLRERIRELEERIASAPPWERRRIEYRLRERQHEYRESCRR